MNRRTYLTTVTATGLPLAIAGCTGGDDTDDGDANGDDANGDDGYGDDANGDVNGEGRVEDPDLAGTFDDFAELEAWEAVAGSLDADTERSVEGSQSARLTATEGESRIRIVRELSDPIDVSEFHPGLAMTSTAGGNPIIQLHDDKGDFLQYQQHVTAGMPFVRNNFGLVDVSGEPDRTEITEIQLIYWVGDETAGELWVDDLHFVGRVESGHAMIQLLGGYETHYSEALEILDDHDLTGVAFLPTARIRDSEEADGDRLTTSQVEVIADAGWSICSYGARGLRLTELDGDDLVSEVADPLDWLDENGYARGNDVFASPGAWYDEESYELVSDHYDLAFGGNAPAQGVAGNAYTCSQVHDPGPQEAVDLLDWTAEHGGITAFAFYQLQEAESLAGLEEVARHLSELESAGEIESITPDQLADGYVFDG